MIRFVKGDIFASKAQTLVNPVNCEGVMGKGLAKGFKERWPEMYRAYQNSCKNGEVRVGWPSLWVGPDRWVLNFPTKDSWRNPSRMEYIEKGLAALKKNLKGWGIQSLAIPALGCGLGGLEWAEVKSRIVTCLETESIDIEVYEP